MVRKDETLTGVAALGLVVLAVAAPVANAGVILPWVEPAWGGDVRGLVPEANLASAPPMAITESVERHTIRERVAIEAGLDSADGVPLTLGEGEPLDPPRPDVLTSYAPGWASARWISADELTLWSPTTLGSEAFELRLNR